MNKLPKIYKNDINNLKGKVQNKYECKNKGNENEINSVEIISKEKLIRKINAILNGKDYIYGVNINIMYKNGEKNVKKIIAFLNDNLITIDGEKIKINDIKDLNVN